jgi:1-deoxy-D-xylulose-5-phosphate reductoisomerase
MMDSSLFNEITRQPLNGRSQKKLAVLGSTGSVGTQTLQVAALHPELYKIILLAAGSNAELLIRQAIIFMPKKVVIADESKYTYVRDSLLPYGIQVSAGKAALCEAVELAEIEIVVAAIIGAAGLEPVISAIRAGKHIALANKECLVVAGSLIMDLVRENHVRLLPVDSEHSAIFQCLTGEKNEDIEKIFITASGGPFRGKNKTFLNTVTPEDALKHPTWSMGKKISIDSASLMNKGLEVIEARWLFDLTPGQIDVVVHPQSVVHSLVQFTDGSIKAQLGLPDMKLPIQYAINFPHRVDNSSKRFSFMDYPELTFEKPDLKTFRNLELAYHALEKGGIIPCALNAANEIAVAAFLNRQIGFNEMSEIIEYTISKTTNIKRPSLLEYLDNDLESRRIALEGLKRFS